MAAGVVAKKIIQNIRIEAGLVEAGGSERIEEKVEQAVAAKDSIGAIIVCQATGLPVGLGEPFFDSVESLISHIIFAVPGISEIRFGRIRICKDERLCMQRPDFGRER